MVLEIAVSNIEAAILAEKAGANRIELCDNLTEGGTTPSVAYIAYALQQVTIPVFPIIRPRGGDFLYTAAEFEIMLRDVETCKNLGCVGMVTGLLNADGTVDRVRTKKLVEAAGSMEVTFHRAFDRSRNPFEALEAIIDTGCSRILSSGMQSTAEKGLNILADLVKQAGNRIVIMPGSGVRSSNLELLLQKTGAKEYHSSAATTQRSSMIYKNENFATDDGNYQSVNAEEIFLQKEILNRHPISNVSLHL
jgi:copper homeostasis protein